METLEQRWYVIKTARFKENYVEHQLVESIGIETYCPLVKVPRRRLRKAQRELEPLFPGYLFAHLDLHLHGFHLRGIRAFTSLVAFDGRPASLDSSVIDELRRREQGRGYILLGAENAKFRVHEPLRITEGPFSGQTGLFVRYIPSTRRICILFEILKTQAVLELPLSSVSAAGSRDRGDISL